MTAPEFPHADFIADMRAYAGNSTMHADVPAELLRQAADALAALGDTVPREQYDEAVRLKAVFIGRALAHRRERDEARAERDALATREAQVRAWIESSLWDHAYIRESLLAMLSTAPAVSLALHDAEVKAQALDEARETRDPIGPDDGIGRWLRARAAAIREEAGL